MNADAPAGALGATRCRTCSGTRLIDFLDLGVQPIANRYVAAADRGAPEPAFPLHAHACLDCALIQVPDRVPAEFFRHYLYVPSAAEGLRRHFASLADRLAHDAYVPAAGYLVEGLSRVGDTQLYVTRGAGYWGPPMRVGARPEVTVVELRSA